jgi:type II protein arginine methyltransferase
MAAPNLPLDRLVENIADKPVAMAGLARVLLAKGDEANARALATRALGLAPLDGEVAGMAAEVLGHGVPAWHFGIVRDERRNGAYDAALRRAIKPGMRVLDIGAGTGLLAMMAARAGAREVVTCEMNGAVAEAATRVVAANGYADRVRVIARHSADLDAAADLGGGADVVVSEIVSNDLVGEGVLPSLEQAMRRLARPGAVVIPARGTVRVALAHDAGLGAERMARVDGFDLAAFNELAPARHRVASHSERLTLRSEPGELFTFDFQSGGPYPEGRASISLTADGGPVNGVAQWIALEMDEVGRYENRPESGRRSAWAVLFYPMAHAIEPGPGQKVAVRGAHDRQSLRVWAEAT